MIWRSPTFRWDWKTMHHQGIPGWHMGSLGVLAAWFTFGCAGPADSDASAVSVVDSAGFEIVRIPLPDTTKHRWERYSQASVQIGTASGSAGAVLDRVQGAVQLTDGRIVVADGGSAELRYFDATGNLLSRAGGNGEGPGEFESLQFIAALSGDSVLAYDRSLQRVSVFDPRGEFVRSWTTMVPGAPILQTAIGVNSMGGLVLTAMIGRDPEAPGPYFVPQVVGVFDRAAGTYSLLDTIDGSEAAMVDRAGRLLPAILPFGSKSDIAAAGELVFVLDGGSPGSIRVYSSPTGALLRILRFEFPPKAIDEGMTSRWIESFFEKNRSVFANERVAETWQYGFERVAVPDVLPPFRSLEVDGKGGVCAERYGVTETEPPRYWCFSPEGIYKRSVSLATGSRRTGFPHQDPQLEFGIEYVLGVWEDDLGIQSVRQYRSAAADR